MRKEKCTTTQNRHKKLKPGLVAFYDIWPGNGAGLFSKEKMSRPKGGDKWEKVKKRVSVGAYCINKQTMYSRNQKSNQGRIMPRSPHDAREFRD